MAQTQWDKYPCGCRTAIVDDTFVLEACPVGEACEVVKIVIQETQNAGHPYSIVDVTKDRHG